MAEITEKTRALCWLPHGQRWDTFSNTEKDDGRTRTEEYTRLAGRLETFVRAVHDAGGEDYRPVVAGEVLPQAALTRPDALRESAREAHAKGRITSADLADRLSRIAFTEEQDKRDG